MTTVTSSVVVNPFDQESPRSWIPGSSWDFEHGPRWQDWLARTGPYDPNFCPWKSDSTSFEVWLRAVPGLVWVNRKTRKSWFGAYLWELRLIVVDGKGLRRPLLDDVLEERTCQGLVRIAKPFGKHVARRHREFRARQREVSNCTSDIQTLFDEITEDLWYEYAACATAFAKSLEVRDLGGGRLVVAFGSRASLPEGFGALQSLATEPSSAGAFHYFAETAELDTQRT